MIAKAKRIGLTVAIAMVIVGGAVVAMWTQTYPGGFGVSHVGMAALGLLLAGAVLGLALLSGRARKFLAVGSIAGLILLAGAGLWSGGFFHRAAHRAAHLPELVATPAPTAPTIQPAEDPRVLAAIERLEKAIATAEKDKTGAQAPAAKPACPPAAASLQPNHISFAGSPEGLGRFVKSYPAEHNPREIE